MSNLADARAKLVKITLNDGVERTLKFTLNAMAELEDKYGSVQAAFDKLQKENSLKALRSVLWAGLLHEDPTITEQQVGDLIDLASMQSMVTTLGDAMDAAFPDEEVVAAASADPN